MAKPKITEQMPSFLRFLQDMEAKGQVFGPEDIAKATGYELKGTVKTKLGTRNEWGEFLIDLGDWRYKARGTQELSIAEFAYRLSSKYQRQHRGGGSDKPKTEVSLLLEGAAQEFQLAIELFNRPTTPNRVEAFVVHFINAWEKLLKARLVKRDGPASIWVESKERKSISLRVALDRSYPAMDKVRQNVQYIEDLRDDATHYMLPALDAIASRYFQSGVMNFFREFMAEAGRAPLRMNGVGLMSIVVDGAEHSKATLTMQYGEERAKRILARIQEMEKAAKEIDDPAFAIPLHLSVGFVDKRANPEQTIAGLTGMIPIVVNKPVDPKKSHPHEVNHIVAEVNKRLRSIYSDDAFRKLFTGHKKPEFNTHDFSSISSMEGWKKNSNDYHFDHGTPVQHTYSDACIEFILNKLAKHPDYLGRAKKKEVEKRKRKK